MKNIKLAVVFFAAFLMLFAGGCAKKTNVITLEFWTLQLSPVFDNYFKTVIKKYEAEHPNIKIRWVDIPYDAAVQKLMASIAAGKPPDAVNLSADFLSKFAGINALTDITTVIPRDSLYIYLPNALQSCTFNNKVVALPWYLSTYVLLYNKAFFADAGFTEKDIPKTFKELVKFAREYKNRTNKYPLFWNIGKDSYLPMMLESEGVSMTDPEMKKATFNSPQGITLISQWVDLYREKYLQSESIMKPGSSIAEAYQSGQVAMIFTGPVFIKRIKTNAPEIYKNTDVSLAIVGQTGKHELAVMSLSIMAQSKYKKETAEFLKYLTNAQNQLEFAKLSTTYPSVKEALKDSYFVALDGTPEAKARVIGAIELPYADRLRKYLAHPQFDRLRDIFDEAIQSACLGKTTTAEALNQAAEKWDEILLQDEK